MGRIVKTATKQPEEVLWGSLDDSPHGVQLPSPYLLTEIPKLTTRLQLVDEAILLYKLKGVKVGLLRYIVWKAGTNRGCFVERKDIARLVGYGLATVHAGIKSLVDVGLLRLQKRHKKSAVIHPFTSYSTAVPPVPVRLRTKREELQNMEFHDNVKELQNMEFHNIEELQNLAFHSNKELQNMEFNNIEELQNTPSETPEFEPPLLLTETNRNKKETEIKNFESSNLKEQLSGIPEKYHPVLGRFLELRFHDVVGGKPIPAPTLRGVCSSVDALGIEKVTAALEKSAAAGMFRWAAVRLLLRGERLERLLRDS